MKHKSIYLLIKPNKQMKCLKHYTLLLLLFCSISFGGQNKTGALNTHLGIKINGNKISEALSFFPDNEPGGTFLITQNGENIASIAFGKSNLELDVNMKIDNVFNIESATKPFTAVAIFKLIEEGKISLEDKISKFIPKFSDKGQNITVGHLLSHSSGMEYKNDQVERNNLKKAIRMKNSISISKYFTDEKFDSEPGMKHDYNNAAYQILGYIIEKITLKPYEV